MPHGYQVNYDQLASTYDQRYAKGNDMVGTLQTLVDLATSLQAERILEVGCGTGQWLSELAVETTRQMVGLDYSGGMLAQARHRHFNFYLVQGLAGRLPFAPASFDLIYCVNAIHHFLYQRDFIHAAKRMLRPGGVLAVAGNDPRPRREQWYIYDYFDGSYETDLARFPSWGTVLEWMIEAGFSEANWRLVDRLVDPKVGREVLEDPFLKKHATSQLALLSDEAYEAGLNKIKQALRDSDSSGQSLIFPTEIIVSVLTGWA